ncbi:DUF5819 family protein [Ruania zhangjianzhongii]|uniref:DUF5819 family protein n=1 Tax=Ruania zhangjianzhongii TaxID=2603206 RepID=UPI001C9E8B32|nr:DUF5819 family protein [Ruania zhangjianzhongii]
MTKSDSQEAAPDTEEPREHTRLTTVKRVVILLGAFFTAWHIFATFLWIAPGSGLRDVVPGTLLHDYMIPMHGQSWSVFAPNPINGDYRLQVRAVTGSGEDAVETEWVDATAAEITMLTHNLFPPRASNAAMDVASRFKGAFDDLNEAQQEIVALGYYQGEDWRDRLQAALLEHGNEAAVMEYLETERLAGAYSTQVAQALWGEDVQQVQFIVSRQNVIPFAERNNPDAERPAVQPAPTGWRGPIVEPGQSQERFAEIFLTGVEESGQ